MSGETKVTNEDIYNEIKAMRSDIVELKEFNAGQVVRNTISAWVGRASIAGIIGIAIKTVFDATAK